MDETLIDWLLFTIKSFGLRSMILLCMTNERYVMSVFEKANRPLQNVSHSFANRMKKKKKNGKIRTTHR